MPYHRANHATWTAFITDERPLGMYHPSVVSQKRSKVSSACDEVKKKILDVILTVSLIPCRAWLS